MFYLNDKIIDLEIICQQTGDTVRNLKRQESLCYHEEDRLIYLEIAL